MISFMGRHRSSLFLSLILVLGLAIRLSLSAHEGYSFDVSTNAGWGRTALLNGVATSYTEQIEGTMIPDYPPFSLMIYKEAMRLHQSFHTDFVDESVEQRVFMKLPAILVDLFMALTCFFIIRRLYGEAKGMLAAILFLLHPAVLLDSAVWGQTDIIFSWFSFLAAVSMVSGGTIAGGGLAVLAVLTKFQGVMFLPLLAVLGLHKPRKIYKAVIGSLIPLIIVFAPFALHGTFWEMIEAFTKPVGSYTGLSINAYNFWWSMFSDSAGSHIDTEIFFWGINYRHFGIIVSGLLYAWILLRLWLTLRSTDKYAARLEAILGAGALCSMAFFVFNTEMHERYLFPFVLFGFPLMFMRRVYILPYVLISICFCMNIVGVLQVTPIERALYDAFPALDVFIASAQVMLFFIFTYRVRVHAFAIKRSGHSIWRKMLSRFHHLRVRRR